MSTFDDLYTLSRQLGSGGFGCVYKCYEQKTGNAYAVKFFSDMPISRKTYSSSDKMKIPDEIILWRNLRHKNVIRYVRHFFERGTWIVVMEHCSGYKDLFSYVNKRESPMSESTAASIISQTLDAVMYCRSKKIDHRDIKDENLLYNPKTKHVMLIDFGSSSLVSSTYTRLQGTDVYHPPELFLDGSFKSTDGVIWAVGSLAYILLNGDCPYQTLDDLKGDVPIVWMNEKSSSLAVRFVRRCLRRKPVDRDSLSLLRKSAWLKNFKN